jgi:hypothetical protein
MIDNGRGSVALDGINELMRDTDVVASELRLLAAVRRSYAEVGAPMPRIEPGPISCSTNGSTR